MRTMKGSLGKRAPAFLVGLAIIAFQTGAARGQVRMSEDFEDGAYADNFTLWLQNTNCCTDTTAAVSQAAAHNGRYGFDIRYVLDDDPRGDCAQHQDNNTSLVHYPASQLTHYFVRGYFKFAMTPEQLCAVPIVQRKLIYFKGAAYDQDGGHFILNAWPWGHSGGCAANGYNVTLNHMCPAGFCPEWGDDASAGWDTAHNHLRADIWYYLEAEVQYAAYGHDTLRVWLGEDGGAVHKIFDRSDLSLRLPAEAAAGTPLGHLEVGRQVDLTRSNDNGVYGPPVDEHRYWDDIVLSESYVGPTGASPPDTTLPAAPRNLRVLP